jgi:hypothetical protein
MGEETIKMRSGWAFGAAGLLLAGPALAAPSVEIKDAAVRVVVVPEARDDIKVQLASASRALPLIVRVQGQRTVVDGRLRHRISGCSAMFGRTMVRVRGLGQVSYDDLPQLVVHAPLDVRVGAGGAVFGSIGRARSVELSNEGCGDWTIANVEGDLKINEAGSGDVRAGRAGRLVIHVAGSGDVATRDIAGPAVVDIAGSGDVNVASVSGDLRASVAGSGDVKVAGGKAPNLVAHLAGSGDVDFEGEAGSVSAAIAGSGDVNVAKASGPVKKSVFGSGGVNIGR